MPFSGVPDGPGAVHRGGFFAPVPADPVLALARSRAIRRPDALLLIALLSYRRRPDAAEVFPAQETLAATMECSVRTVQRGLDRLVASGLIRRRFQRDVLGRLRGRCYDLAPTLALLPRRPPTDTTNVTPGCRVVSAHPSSDGLPAPTRQPCRVELDSEVVEINNTVPPVALELMACGVFRSVALSLAQRCGEARCRRALAALRARRGVRDRAAWLVGCLRQGWDLTDTPPPPPAAPAVRPRVSSPPSPHPNKTSELGLHWDGAGGSSSDPLARLAPAEYRTLEERARESLLAEGHELVCRQLRRGRGHTFLRPRMRALLAA